MQMFKIDGILALFPNLLTSIFIWNIILNERSFKEKQ